MKKRKRKMVEFCVNFSVIVRLSPRALKQGMGKGFAESIRPMTTVHEVAEHVAFNMVENGIDLSMIDGFANLPATDAERDRVEVDDVYAVGDE